MSPETCLLSDLAEIIVGFPFKSEDYNTDGKGVKLVRGVNVTTGFFRWGADSRWWSDLNSGLSPYYLKKDDIIIGMDGSRVGKNYVMVQDCELPLLLVQRVACIRAKEGIDQNYLWSCICSPKFEAYVDLIKTGTTIPHISAKQIGDYPIPLVSKSIQSVIGYFSKIINSKIQVIQVINDNLTRECQLILNYYISTNQTHSSTIGDHAVIIDCLHSKKPELQESGKRFIQLDNIRDDGLLDFSNQFWISDSDYNLWTSRCEVSEGDIVITNVGRIGAVSQMPIGEKAAMGRNMTCIRPHSNPAFLITYLLSERMRNEIEYNTDAGTIMNALNVRSIPNLVILAFEESVQYEIETILRSIRQKMENNLKESHRLVQLRDYLLPKLMSGEIDISTIELPTKYSFDRLLCYVFLVRVLYILLIDHGIMERRIYPHMTQQFLNLLYRHALIDSTGGHGASEFMRMDIFDSCGLFQSLQHSLNAVNTESLRRIMQCDEQCRIIVRTPIEVILQMKLRSGIEIDLPFASALSEHDAFPFVEIDVRTVEPYQLTHPHTGRDERIDYG